MYADVNNIISFRILGHLYKAEALLLLNRTEDALQVVTFETLLAAAPTEQQGLF